MANAVLTVRAGLRSEKLCFSYEIPPNVARKIDTSEVYRRDAVLSPVPVFA